MPRADGDSSGHVIRRRGCEHARPADRVFAGIFVESAEFRRRPITYLTDKDLEAAGVEPEKRRFPN